MRVHFLRVSEANVKEDVLYLDTAQWHLRHRKHGHRCRLVAALGFPGCPGKCAWEDVRGQRFWQIS